MRRLRLQSRRRSRAKRSACHNRSRRHRHVRAAVAALTPAIRLVRESVRVPSRHPCSDASAMKLFLAPFHRAGLLALLLAMTLGLPSCGGVGAFNTGVGDTPNLPPQSAFRVLGQVGMQFTALVSDARFSWSIQGSIPLSVIIVNNTTPVRMTVTKLS